MKMLNSLRVRPFYIGLSVLIGVIVTLGFWPSYFGPLMNGTVLKPLRIHVHAVVFVGWLVLFSVQVLCAAMGNIKWHKRLGHWGMAYGLVLIGVGIYTAVARAALETGEFYGPVLDMVIFAVFLGLAFYYRKKPKFHTKLMIVATTMLLIAAVGRLWFIPALPESMRTPVFLFIWFLPVILAVVRDYLGQQRIHPIYIAGFMCFIFRKFSPEYVVHTTAWITVKQAAISAYLML